MRLEERVQLIVVGGGAAGMAAASAAAERGVRVLLLEQNEKLGKKIYITGKGRCNFTNDCEVEDFFSCVPQNSKFLYSSLYGFPPKETEAWFQKLGLRIKLERGNRVFPESDHASDVTRVLEGELRRLGVLIRLKAKMTGLLMNEERTGVLGVILESGEKISSDAVILATGGLAYPSTGARGDGYLFAREAGHSISALSPSLVPLETMEADLPSMQGLSLKNVALTVFQPGGKKKLYEDFGEMMFTHFGITGPLVLSASSRITKYAVENRREGSVPLKEALHAELDLKAALSQEKLDLRLIREISKNPARSLKNMLLTLFPASLARVMLERCDLPGDLPSGEMTRKMRERLLEETKHFHITVKALRSFREAVITRGGVRVGEVNPHSMASKKLEGLFFAGELLDVDGLTGGFNLQIAWSTGRSAGQGAAEKILGS